MLWRQATRINITCVSDGLRMSCVFWQEAGGQSEWLATDEHWSMWSKDMWNCDVVCCESTITRWRWTDGIVYQYRQRIKDLLPARIQVRHNPWRISVHGTLWQSDGNLSNYKVRQNISRRLQNHRNATTATVVFIVYVKISFESPRESGAADNRPFDTVCLQTACVINVCTHDSMMRTATATDVRRVNQSRARQLVAALLNTSDVVAMWMLYTWVM